VNACGRRVKNRSAAAATSALITIATATQEVLFPRLDEV
jgi:hypothetical protein